MENEIQTVSPTPAELQTIAPASPMAMIMQLCKANSDIDIDKMSKALELQEKWDALQAKKAYVVAMAEFKKNPPEVLKDKRVKYTTTKGTTEYDHASLNNVTTIISKFLSDHGLTASWITDQGDGGIKVTCKITHIDGHSEETSLTAAADASGGKNSIQAIGSTVSYLRRYTLEAITGIASKDIEDDDGKGADEKPAMPAKPTKFELAILETIKEKLENKTGGVVDINKLAATFYTNMTGEKKYPTQAGKEDVAADWVLSLGKNDEWLLAEVAVPVKEK